MKYRLVALDLDDTLLRDDLTISDRTREVLIGAQMAGVTLVLASGRPTGSIQRYALELQLDAFGGYMLGFNGGEVTSCTSGKVLFQQSLGRDEVHELYDLSRAHGLSILSYQGSNIVTAEANPWADIEKRLTGLDVVVAPDFKAAMDGPAVKAILVQEPDRIKKAAADLAPVVGGRFNLAISKPYFLEVTAKGIDKAHSLALLADKIGVPRAEVMAIGDSYNDLGMLAWAGLGVCMANGPEEVRNQADFITGTNHDDGVADAVERFVLDDEGFLAFE
jgi:Cof subfamily protein (haloacid dehalogenase superfamily)